MNSSSALLFTGSPEKHEEKVVCVCVCVCVFVCVCLCVLCVCGRGGGGAKVRAHRCIGSSANLPIIPEAHGILYRSR